MKTAYNQLYNERKDLLKDYLTMKYSSDTKEHEEIIGQLLSTNMINSREIHVIDGIIFNEVLMVIKCDNSQKIEHLYILDSETKEKKFFHCIFDDNKIIAK